MDKPSPDNPNLHDWLGTIGAGPKPFDAGAFDPKLILETLSAGIGPMKAMAIQQTELGTLASRRAQAYLGIPQRLTRCRTRQDLFDEQMRFWQTAMSQYQESATRICQAWSDVFKVSQTASASSVAFPQRPTDRKPHLIKVRVNGELDAETAPDRAARPRRDPT
jgi:hypothetical protein